MSKEYVRIWLYRLTHTSLRFGIQVDGDRGRWLYRSYMVGNAEGNLSGRWRDTLSPPDVLGYEGCFVMSRRK